MFSLSLCHRVIGNPVYKLIDKKCSQGNPYYVYTTTGTNSAMAEWMNILHLCHHKTSNNFVDLISPTLCGGLFVIPIFQPV